MKVTISSVFVEEKKWTKDVRSGVIRTQEAVAECPKFRQRIKLDLGNNAEPFAVGDYACDLEDSITVDQFGNLKLGRLVLTPAIKPAATANKAA